MTLDLGSLSCTHKGLSKIASFTRAKRSETHDPEMGTYQVLHITAMREM